MADMLPQTDMQASGVGALPHTDPASACRAVVDAFPSIPYAPTLPARDILESIVFNDCEYLPGKVIRDEKLWVDTASDHSEEMEKILLDYMEGNFEAYPVGMEYNSGFHAMMEQDLSNALMVKTQVTGLVTFGMQVVDSGKRPILYDPEYADILSKMLAMRARWYESVMEEKGAVNTLVVMNEPYLASLGSSVVPIDADTVRSGIGDAADILKGGLGIHCCSNTDWEFVMSLPIGMVSIDAYQYSGEFMLYAESMAGFMERGGVVAWGIVPAEYEIFTRETFDSLHERLAGIMSQACESVDEDIFFERSMITPTCGIRFADVKGAEEIMQAAASLSARMREGRF